MSRQLCGGQKTVCGSSSHLIPCVIWRLNSDYQASQQTPTPLSYLDGPKGLPFFFLTFVFFSSKVRHCFKGIVSLNDCSWGFSWLTTACPWGTDGLSWVRLGSAGPPILSRCLHFGLLTLNPFWGDKGPAWRQHWLCSELSLLWGKSNHVLRLRGPPSQNPTSLFTKVPSWSYHIYIPPMYYFIHTKE